MLSFFYCFSVFFCTGDTIRFVWTRFLPSKMDENIVLFRSIWIHVDEALMNEMVLPRRPVLFVCFYHYGLLVLKLNDVG